MKAVGVGSRHGWSLMRTLQPDQIDAPNAEAYHRQGSGRHGGHEAAYMNGGTSLIPPSAFSTLEGLYPVKRHCV